MVFPIGDDNSDRTITPFCNYTFVALNIMVFVFFQGMGSNLEFTYAFSTVPGEILTGTDVVTQGQQVTDPQTGQVFTIPGLMPTPVHVWLTLITSMFMHGGFAHIFGNMLYLWIFGDNLENRMGHLRYTCFYLVCGVAASLAHVFTSYYTNNGIYIPSLGASGAISGVLGGYLVLFPKRRVTVILLRVIQQVPAFVALGIWIVFQIVSGIGMLGGKSDGVAYAAHIGGFLAGMLLVKFFDKGEAPSIRRFPA